MQDAAADGADNRLEFSQRHIGLLGIDVDYHVADVLVGLQVLGGDVDLLVRESAVDLFEDPRAVFVDVEQARPLGVNGQRYFRASRQDRCST